MTTPGVRREPDRSSRTLLWLWVPVVLYVAGIFYVSSLPQPPAIPADVGDKTLHGLAYAGLAALLVRALSGGRWGGVSWRVAAGAVSLAVAYGVTDEWHQSFVPGRTADPRDIVADAVGATGGALACYLVARMQRRRHRRHASAHRS